MAISLTKCKNAIVAITIHFMTAFSSQGFLNSFHDSIFPSGSDPYLVFLRDYWNFCKCLEIEEKKGKLKRKRR